MVKTTHSVFIFAILKIRRHVNGIHGSNSENHNSSCYCSLVLGKQGHLKKWSCLSFNWGKQSGKLKVEAMGSDRANPELLQVCNMGGSKVSPAPPNSSGARHPHRRHCKGTVGLRLTTFASHTTWHLRMTSEEPKLVLTKTLWKTQECRQMQITRWPISMAHSSTTRSGLNYKTEQRPNTGISN